MRAPAFPPIAAPAPTTTTPQINPPTPRVPTPIAIQTGVAANVPRSSVLRKVWIQAAKTLQNNCTGRLEQRFFQLTTLHGALHDMKTRLYSRGFAAEPPRADYRAGDLRQALQVCQYGFQRTGETLITSKAIRRCRNFFISTNLRTLQHPITPRKQPPRRIRHTPTPLIET